MYKYEVVNLPDETIEQWLKEVIDDGVGNLKVINSGGDWIIYDSGQFHMKWKGITKQVFKSNELAKDIFRKRINRYMNVEHAGYRYHFHNGKWKKVKVTFKYD